MCFYCVTDGVCVDEAGVIVVVVTVCLGVWRCCLCICYYRGSVACACVVGVFDVLLLSLLIFKMSFCNLLYD